MKRSYRALLALLLAAFFSTSCTPSGTASLVPALGARPSDNTGELPKSIVPGGVRPLDNTGELPKSIVPGIGVRPLDNTGELSKSIVRGGGVHRSDNTGELPKSAQLH